MDRMQSQVEELPENRVRLTVQVPSHDVHTAVEHAAGDLAQSVKVPGFRKGRVPRQVLLQRVGRERLMTEAVESHIGGWFWNAAARSRVRPVAQPEYDFELPATDDQDWEFTATVAVQAKPELPDWKELEVGAAEVEVPEELVQAELDALRATVAELVPVEGRPVGPDDTVIVDLVSEEETRRDYVVDLGRGAVVEEVEQGLVGMNAGDTKEMSFELADGSTQSLTATVKEIKEKVLPPLDDDLARAASEFETFAVCEVTPPTSVTKPPKWWRLNRIMSAGERSCATTISFCSSDTAGSAIACPPISAFSTRSTACCTSALRSRRYASSISSKRSTSRSICCTSAHSALARRLRISSRGTTASAESLRIMRCRSRKASNSFGASGGMWAFSACSSACAACMARSKRASSASIASAAIS